MFPHSFWKIVIHRDSQGFTTRFKKIWCQRIATSRTGKGKANTKKELVGIRDPILANPDKSKRIMKIVTQTGQAGVFTRPKKFSFAIDRQRAI